MCIRDRYNFVYFIVGDEDAHKKLKDPGAARRMRERTQFPLMNFNRYVERLRYNRTPSADDQNLFIRLEGVLRITNSDYKIVRRNIFSFQRISTREKQSTITRLLLAARAKLRTSDVIGYIEELSALKDLEIFKVTDPEPKVSVPDVDVTGKDLGGYRYLVGAKNLLLTKKFLDSGAEVIIWDLDKTAAQKAMNENKDKKLSYKILDITNFEEIQKNVKEISEKKKIDILVNNAGITGKNASVWEYPVEEWKKVLDTNLQGTFYCCKAVVPIMIKNNYGRIVNVASISGKEGNANASAYSSAKAGVIGLTKALGKELANKNIAVNAVTPTTANTRILKQMTDKHVKFMLSKVPRNRYLELNELASMVAWLSSDENSFSTGAVFDISGGRATY